MTLKWCRKNLEAHSQAVYDLILEEYPHVQCEVADCVDKCGLCTDVPFAIRNNATILARDPRGLYAKLKQGFGFLEKPPLPGSYDYAMAQQAAESAGTGEGEPS